MPYMGGLSFQKVSQEIPKNFDTQLTDDELKQVRLKLDSAGVRLLTYYIQNMIEVPQAGRGSQAHGHLIRDDPAFAKTAEHVPVGLGNVRALVGQPVRRQRHALLDRNEQVQDDDFPCGSVRDEGLDIRGKHRANAPSVRDALDALSP